MCEGGGGEGEGVLLAQSCIPKTDNLLGDAYKDDGVVVYKQEKFCGTTGMVRLSVVYDWKCILINRFALNPKQSDELQDVMTR